MRLCFREKIRSELEDHIRCQLYKEAKLTMFGSSCNGFGFANSDLDLCFTLESDPDGKVMFYAVSFFLLDLFTCRLECFPV